VDGAKKKVSSGTFEFARPNRFRFSYLKPFEQQIVSDGQKVWIYDADLNQVTVRKLGQALGATPAALLAGAALEKEFDLSAQPSAEGIDWVMARPRQKDGAFESMRIGFRG
jgi:outer membrane lipoprotein carrier protein